MWKWAKKCKNSRKRKRWTSAKTIGVLLKALFLTIFEWPCSRGHFDFSSKCQGCQWSRGVCCPGCLLGQLKLRKPSKPPKPSNARHPLRSARLQSVRGWQRVVAQSLQENPWTSAEKAIFTKFQAPKFENSEPAKHTIPHPQPFHTPIRLPRTRFAVQTSKTEGHTHRALGKRKHTLIFAENRRFSQIRPFFWRFKHMEGAGFSQKTDDFRRKPQETADWALSPQVRHLWLGPSVLWYVSFPQVLQPPMSCPGLELEWYIAKTLQPPKRDRVRLPKIRFHANPAPGTEPFSGTQSTVARVRLQPVCSHSSRCLAVLVWQYFEEAFCTPKVRLKWSGFKGFPSHSSHCSGGLFPLLRGQPNPGTCRQTPWSVWFKPLTL